MIHVDFADDGKPIVIMTVDEMLRSNNYNHTYCVTDISEDRQRVIRDTTITVLDRMIPKSIHMVKRANGTVIDEVTIPIDHLFQFYPTIARILNEQKPEQK